MAIGSTNRTVGKAIIQESPQALSHVEIISGLKPSDFAVLISETIPLITSDKKKGTRKIIAFVGSLGRPKIVELSELDMKDSIIIDV